MSSEDDLVILNFTKVLTTPSATIVFNEAPATVEPMYLSLDVLSEHVLTLARESDVECQDLLIRIVIEKFNNGELHALLDSNAVIT